MEGRIYLFLVRGLAKGGFKKLATLANLDASEKNSYILGDRLNVFLEDIKREMPPDATYKFSGTFDPHDHYRLIYHLYPRVQSENPDYIIIVDEKDSQYMLRRVR